MLGNVLNHNANPNRPLNSQSPDQFKGQLKRPLGDRSLGHNYPPKNNLFSKHAKKYVRQSVISLMAFLVAVSLLAKIIPSPTIPSNIVFIGPKYDYYQAHKDEYTALFFGSSRIYNQVIPEIFDATANQLTDPSTATPKINSYNFGIPAMRAIDSAVLLEEILSDPPQNLKWVFFESILDKGYEPIANARTHRAMYWHTWKNTRFAARYIFTSDESLPKKAVLLSSHLLPFLYHQLNVGRLFNQVLPSDFSKEEQTVAADFTAHEGFYTLREARDPKRQDFLHHQADYEQAVIALGDGSSTIPADEAYLSANKQMLLARITQAIRGAGAEPIFLESPSLHTEHDFQAAKQLGIIDTLLSYKDPQRFPQLYRADQRHDADHLNEAGAREFTRLLAEDFSEAIR